MEFVRVFNRKRIIILFVLFIVNGILFYKECDEEEMYKLLDTLILEVNDRTESSVDMKSAALSVLKEIKFTYFEEDEDYSKVREILLKKIDYVGNYSKNIASQIEKSKIVRTSSLYNDKESFPYLNTLKTAHDLELIENVEVNLSNGRWLEKITDYKMGFYLLAISIAIVVYSLVEERKSNVMYLQYSTKNGRGNLLAKRIVICIGISILLTILYYFEISLISLHQYGGYEGVYDSVCSDEQFAMCSIGGMSRIEWLMTNVLWIAFSLCATGLCIWACLTCFNNTNLGLYTFLLIYGIEIMLNGIITEKSVYKFLKFFNIKYLLDSSGAWFSYSNWGYNGIITDLAESTKILIVLVSVVSIIIVLKNNVLSNSLTKIGLAEKLLLRIYEAFIKVVTRLPIWVMESIKLIITQKIGIVLIVILLLFINMNIGYPLKYNAYMSTISNMCDEYKNASTEEIIEKIEELNCDMTKELESEKSYAKVSIIESQIEYLDYVVQKRMSGIDVAVISPYEYEAALGKNQTLNQEFIALMCITLIIMINAGAISYEKKNGMIYVIRASKNRIQWIKKKIIYNCAFSTIVSISLYGWYYYKLIQLYGLERYSASIQSLKIFDCYILNVTIWEFIVIDLVLKLLIIMSIGGIAFGISSVFKYDIGFFVGMIIILPYLLYKCGIEIFSYISLPRIVAYMPMWLEGYGSYNAVADIVIIIVGITGYLYAGYRFVNKFEQ